MTKDKASVRSWVFRSLLERNYSIYISITSDIFCIERSGTIGSCIIITTTKASDGRVLLDLRNPKTQRHTILISDYTYIIAVNVKTDEIWLIPVDDVADNRTLSLSKAKDHYLLLTNSFDNKEALVSTIALREKVDSLEASKALVEIKKQSHDEQAKDVDDVLNTE